MARRARSAHPAHAPARLRRAGLVLAVLLALWMPSGLAQGDLLPSNQDGLADPVSRGRLFDAMAERFEALYWDPARIDWPAWRAEWRPLVTRAETPAAFDAAMRRAVASWRDGHSRWIGARDEASDVTPQWRFSPPRDAPPTEPSPPGVRPSGETERPELGADVYPVDGVGLLVLRAYPGAAADEAGLRRGDVITYVGDEPLDAPGLGWRMLDVVLAALRRGPTDVHVTRPHVGTIDVTLTAMAVPMGARDAATLTLDPATGAVLITLPTFDAGSAQRLHQLIAVVERQDAPVLIVDLRGNPGGSVLDLALAAAAFLPDVPLEAWLPNEPAWTVAVQRTPQALTASLTYARGPFDGATFAMKRLEAPNVWDGPLALLVDGVTASAAEGFAALVMRGRPDALVVGETTAGNVESVQRVTLPGGYAAWLAVAELRHAGGSALAPIEPSVVARFDVDRFATGFDEPFALAVEALLDLPVAVGRWF